MKKIGCLLVLFYVMSVQAQDRTINFIDNDWQKAIELAKKEDKLLFVDAYTTWCGPCKWMAKNMFTKNEIADFYNRHFIALKLDMEKGKGKDFATQYGVRVFPTLLFLNPSGEVVHKSVGASRIPHEYTDIGLRALNPFGSFSVMNKRYAAGERSPEFIEEYMEVLSNANETNTAILSEYYATQSDEEMLSEKNWKIIKRHDVSVDSRGMDLLLKNRDAYKSKYGDDVDLLLGRNHQRWLMEKVTGKKEDRKEMELRMIAVKKKNIPGWQKMILIADLTELKREKRMEEYCEIAVADVGEYFSDDAYALNSFAWTVFEHSKKESDLSEALKWANQALTLEESSAIQDTKANILYKLGKKEEAISAQKKAIDWARTEGLSASDIEELETTLKKFK